MGLEKISLDEGIMDSVIFEENGKKYFKKSLKPIKRSLRRVDGIIRDFLFFPNKNYLVLGGSSKEKFNSEYETWRKWKDSGIECLNLKEFNERETVWEYVKNSKSLNQHFSSGEHVRDFSNFVDLYDSIRRVAKKREDIMYLHADPSLKNFLIKEDGKILPIDSGIVLNRKLGFEKIDNYLLLQTMISICRLPVSYNVREKYLELFSDSFSLVDKKNLLEINRESNKFLEGYLVFRKFAISKIKGARGKI